MAYNRRLRFTLIGILTPVLGVLSYTSVRASQSYGISAVEGLLVFGGSVLSTLGGAALGSYLDRRTRHND